MFRARALFAPRAHCSSQQENRMKLTGILAAAALALGLAGPAAAVEVGDKAPDFELPSTKGGNLKLSSYQGKKNVILQFYVLDFAPT
jgi:hypothetical protein